MKRVTDQVFRQPVVCIWVAAYRLRITLTIFSKGMGQISNLKEELSANTETAGYNYLAIFFFPLKLGPIIAQARTKIKTS
jgi:hypothetical protein